VKGDTSRTWTWSYLCLSVGCFLEQLRPLHVRLEDDLDGGNVIWHDLLLAVEDVDRGGDPEATRRKVTQERRLTLTKEQSGG
jgi:hypothetical protein